MVLLDNDSFLTDLAQLFQKCRSTGSVVVTLKKYDGRTKPPPRKGKVSGGTVTVAAGERKAQAESSKGAGPGERKAQAESSSEPASDTKCLIRASDGKKKISTVVTTKEVIKFQMAYSNLLRAHMDGLKKKAKSSKGNKDAKAPQSSPDSSLYR